MSWHRLILLLMQSLYDKPFHKLQHFYYQAGGKTHGHIPPPPRDHPKRNAIMNSPIIGVRRICRRPGGPGRLPVTHALQKVDGLCCHSPPEPKTQKPHGGDPYEGHAGVKIHPKSVWDGDRPNRVYLNVPEKNGSLQFGFPAYRSTSRERFRLPMTTSSARCRRSRREGHLCHSFRDRIRRDPWFKGYQGKGRYVHGSKSIRLNMPECLEPPLSEGLSISYCRLKRCRKNLLPTSNTLTSKIV